MIRFAYQSMKFVVLYHLFFIQIISSVVFFPYSILGVLLRVYIHLLILGETSLKSTEKII